MWPICTCNGKKLIEGEKRCFVSKLAPLIHKSPCPGAPKPCSHPFSSRGSWRWSPKSANWGRNSSTFPHPAWKGGRDHCHTDKCPNASSQMSSFVSKAVGQSWIYWYLFSRWVELEAESSEVLCLRQQIKSAAKWKACVWPWLVWWLPTWLCHLLPDLQHFHIPVPAVCCFHTAVGKQIFIERDAAFARWGLSINEAGMWSLSGTDKLLRNWERSVH